MSRQMQRVVFSGFGALACLLCCVDIVQPLHEYAISGSVRSEENDSPIPQVHVELRTDAGITIHPIVLTNGNGEFLCTLLMNGPREIALPGSRRRLCLV